MSYTDDTTYIGVRRKWTIAGSFRRAKEVWNSQVTTIPDPERVSSLKFLCCGSSVSALNVVVAMVAYLCDYNCIAHD